jgi:hypothetical protein
MIPTSKRWHLGWVLTLAISALGVSASQAQVEVEASSVSYNSDCILDRDPGLRSVYVRLTFNSGATGARFRVELDPGVTMTYVSESSPYTTLGYALSGISICFGGCLTGEPLIETITFMSYSTDATCSQVRIVPHPAAQTVEVRKCNGSVVAAYAKPLQIVPHGTIPCPCPTPVLFPGTPSAFDCAPVATEATTWGRVKALYTK